MRGFWLLLAGLLLVIGGSWAASRVQSADGTQVSDIRFAGDNGATLRGLLYVPAGVDAAHKAPAILAVHGYINTAETQSAFAIEYARRGYVVLALDQAGQVYFNDKPVNLDQLRSSLVETADANPQTEVQLRADRGVPYGKVVEVIGDAQKAGLTKIGFVADVPPAATPAPAATASQ